MNLAASRTVCARKVMEVSSMPFALLPGSLLVCEGGRRSGRGVCDRLWSAQSQWPGLVVIPESWMAGQPRLLV